MSTGSFPDIFQRIMRIFGVFSNHNVTRRARIPISAGVDAHRSARPGYFLPKAAEIRFSNGLDTVSVWMLNRFNILELDMGKSM